MNDQKLLGATMLAALAVQTAGSIRSGHALPPPKLYAAVFLLWFVLGLAAQLGPNVARVAGGLSAVVLLSLLVGKTGGAAIDWLARKGQALGGR